jgi:hypothetical protein
MTFSDSDDRSTKYNKSGRQRLTDTEGHAEARLIESSDSSSDECFATQT